jgi:hypothetical protein
MLIFQLCLSKYYSSEEKNQINVNIANIILK